MGPAPFFVQMLGLIAQAMPEVAAVVRAGLPAATPSLREQLEAVLPPEPASRQAARDPSNWRDDDDDTKKGGH